MSRYSELVNAVIDENLTVLKAIEEREITAMIDEIIKAQQIQIFAMGRMKMSAQGFAMRLMHMGFLVHFVFDATCPRIGPGDLLIVQCAATTIELGVIQLAKEAGARVCVVTAHPESELAEAADITVRVPGQIFGGRDEVPSIQPMASLLEQSLVLFEDIVAMLLMEQLEIGSKDMEERHTNLEGVMGEFAGE
ncbi:MAG TPA: SIS domain-containing protein [Spirochaetia bacterium]|nr:SIS domain-containing protein [Spirochaetia bacterium]